MDPAVGDRVEHTGQRFGGQVRFEFGQIVGHHHHHGERPTAVRQLDGPIVLGDRGREELVVMHRRDIDRRAVGTRERLIGGGCRVERELPRCVERDRVDEHHGRRRIERTLRE